MSISVDLASRMRSRAQAGYDAQRTETLLTALADQLKSGDAQRCLAALRVAVASTDVRVTRKVASAITSAAYAIRSPWVTGMSVVVGPHGGLTEIEHGTRYLRAA